MDVVRGSAVVFACVFFFASLASVGVTGAEGDDETFEYAMSVIASRRFETDQWKTLELDDDEVVELRLQHEVSFFGYETRRLHVASNGFVALGPYTGSADPDPWHIPAGDSVNGMIAGLWTNFDPGHCDSRIAVDVADDWISVAYENVTYHGSTCAYDPPPVPLRVPFPITGGPFPDNEPPPPARTADFLLRISPATGVVEIHLYRADGGYTAASGIEGFHGRNGIQTRYTSAALAQPISWRFEPLGYRADGPTPYSVQHEWRGHVTCSVGISQVTTQALCAPIDDTRFRIGGSSSTRDIMIAMRWNATGALDEVFRVAAVDQNEAVLSVYGESPIVARATSRGWSWHGFSFVDFTVYAAGVPGVVVDVPFEAVLESFHHGRAPEDWNPFEQGQ